MGLGFGIPFGLFFLLASKTGSELFKVLGILFGMVGSAIGLVAGLAIPYQLFKRQAEKVRNRARQIVLKLELTTPVVCSNCGGHAAVISIGPEDPNPCPWCESGLLPTGSMNDSMQAVIPQLLAHHRTLDSRTSTPTDARVPGYKLMDGCLVKGSTDGVPVRAFNELYEGVFIKRLEIPVETGISCEIWLIQPEVESTMRNLTTEWGYSLPSLCVATYKTWRMYSDQPGVIEPSILGGILDALGTTDSLLIDPAGISLWRKSAGLSRAWNLLEEHHHTMAALTRWLQKHPFTSYA
jgi:hypothetical protein